MLTVLILNKNTMPMIEHITDLFDIFDNKV